MLRIYNTLTKKIEPFTPLKGKAVRMYSCGPTVYSTAHIGNMRTFLMADIIKRILKVLGFSVTHVMNITDVGHLTHDSEGHDKVEQAAVREKKSAREIAAFYTENFFRDLKRLDIIAPDHTPKATEYIDAQIELITLLQTKGVTYRTSDGIYFDTSAYKDYSALSGQPVTEKYEGARVDVNPEKRNFADFALWKFSPKDSQRQMEWNSPWGVGFPGWHIECSAMSRALLGQPFDIHTGGVDLISPHHDNEIAQSVVAFGVSLARFWMHGEFIVIGGDKMAKSEGNVYTLDDLGHHGFHPISFRYLALGAHYRSKLHFTFDALTAAQHALENIRDALRTWHAPGAPDRGWIATFRKAIEDDMDMPKVIALLWEIVKSPTDTEIKSATVLALDEVLGLHLAQWINTPFVAPHTIVTLAREREDARAQKDFARADALRLQIESQGFLIEDTASGFVINEGSFAQNQEI